MANHAHRLPPPARNIRHDHLNRNSLSLLRSQLNNPPGLPKALGSQFRPNRDPKKVVASTRCGGRGNAGLAVVSCPAASLILPKAWLGLKARWERHDRTVSAETLYAIAFGVSAGGCV